MRVTASQPDPSSGTICWRLTPTFQGSSAIPFPTLLILCSVIPLPPLLYPTGMPHITAFQASLQVLILLSSEGQPHFTWASPQVLILHSFEGEPHFTRASPQVLILHSFEGETHFTQASPQVLILHSFEGEPHLTDEDAEHGELQQLAQPMQLLRSKAHVGIHVFWLQIQHCFPS